MNNSERINEKEVILIVVASVSGALATLLISMGLEEFRQLGLLGFIIMLFFTIFLMIFLVIIIIIVTKWFFSRLIK